MKISLFEIICLISNIDFHYGPLVFSHPKVVWVGSLREIHVSITGDPDDHAVEVASEAWFGSLVWSGAVGLVFGGPVGLAAGVAVGGIMAYEFEKHIWEKVLEVVKKESAVQPTIDLVNHYNE
jgi:hypothetical protein